MTYTNQNVLRAWLAYRDTRDKDHDDTSVHLAWHRWIEADNCQRRDRGERTVPASRSERRTFNRECTRHHCQKRFNRKGLAA